MPSPTTSWHWTRPPGWRWSGSLLSRRGLSEVWTMNRDFAEMLGALSDAGADFLVIGAHAVAVHALPRATGDLGIWVWPTPENAARVWTALGVFGAPLHQLTQEDLASDDLVFQIGVPPNRIDLLTTIGGVRFDEAWPRRTTVELWGMRVPVMGPGGPRGDKDGGARRRG